MFQEVATQLLHLMDHSGAVPGAFSAEDVPKAFAALQHQVEQQPHRMVGVDKISLRQRATPLLALLKHALEHHYPVIWD